MIVAIRVVVVIFVAIRLLYNYNNDNSPPKALLFVLNLARLLFIFANLVLHGPALLNYDPYKSMPRTIIIIIILFLTSFKIEYIHKIHKIQALSM